MITQAYEIQEAEDSTLAEYLEPGGLCAMNLTNTGEVRAESRGFRV